MTAGTVEERVKAFAELARETADGDIEATVHELTHEKYLLKHTTSDILTELNQLQEAYSEEFYDGDANTHIMTYLNNDPDLEFWSDCAAISLAAGLEWAVLREIQTGEPR